MAEREGFEPSVPLFEWYTRFPVALLRPARTSLRNSSLELSSGKILDNAPVTRRFIKSCEGFDWRRGWDSNPRAPLLTGQVDFESTPLRPLRYLSFIDRMVKVFHAVYGKNLVSKHGIQTP